MNIISKVDWDFAVLVNRDNMFPESRDRGVQG